MACPCGSQWRFETFGLDDGVVTGVLPVVSAEMQRLLNEPSTAKLTVPVGSVAARDVWPRLRGVGVTWHGIPIWVGWVEALRADAGGTLELGCRSLDGYVDQRMLRNDATFNGVASTAVGAALVAAATAGSSPPLFATAGPGPAVDRTYDATDRPEIGGLLDNLIASLNGPDYRMVPTRAPGVAWSGVMEFVERAGTTIRTPLRARVYASDYGLDVDAADVANFVDARADGVPTQHVDDVTPGWVRWDASPDFDDISTAGALAEQAKGILARNREPFATPTIDLPGDRYDVTLEPGDRLERVVIDHPAGLCYDGPARVVGITWKGAADNPDVRQVIVTTDGTSAETAILDAPCSDPCPDCPPTIAATFA